MDCQKKVQCLSTETYTFLGVSITDIWLLHFRASWSMCCKDWRIEFHTEVQDGIIWCDLFFSCDSSPFKEDM